MRASGVEGLEPNIGDKGVAAGGGVHTIGKPMGGGGADGGGAPAGEEAGVAQAESGGRGGVVTIEAPPGIVDADENRNEGGAGVAGLGGGGVERDPDGVGV